MPSSPVELIKEKLDIAEFLRGHVTLQPAGRNFKGLCPFHKEKTPSFMVSPERQTWHCFGCGTGGDIFSFVMRYENTEFGEALRILADKAGVELRRVNPAEHRYTGLLLQINELAKDFFKKQLEGFELARKYLAERNLLPETMEEFEIGWAPNDAEALTFHLLKAGFRPEDLMQAGLSFKTERGAQIDRFRGRIMFPIHDHFGKPVGFTGRILPQFDNGMSGKYVNSPETAIFNKSKLLYGFWKTKNAIRDAGGVFLVEGQMDMLMSYQAGIRNAIATSGTALTPDHLHTLRRFADRLILSFDTDAAGKDAAERAIALAEAADFQVKVADLGEYKDPGDMGAKEPERLVAAVATAKPIQEFYIQKYLPSGGKFDLRDRASLQNLRSVLSKFSKLVSPVEQSFWIGELAKRAGVSDRALREEMQRHPIAASQSTRQEEPSPEEIPERSFSRIEILSQELLGCAMNQSDPGLLGEHAAYLARGYGEVLNLLQEGKRRADDPAMDELLNLIMLRGDAKKAEEVANLKEQLLREYVKERRRELTDAVRTAEVAGDKDAERAALSALAEFQKLPVP